MVNSQCAFGRALRKAGTARAVPLQHQAVPLPKLRSIRFEPGGLRDRTEADHINKCPVCGVFARMRDLAQMPAHVHDAEIEIFENPGPQDPLH